MSVAEYLIFCSMLLLIMPIVLLTTYYVFKKIVIFLFKSFLFLESKFETKTIKNWIRFIRKPLKNVPVVGINMQTNGIRSKFMNIKKDQE